MDAERSEPARLPADFLDEIADELEATRRDATRQAEKLSVLSELQRAAAVAARKLSRPITVFDVVDTAGDLTERDRLAKLISRLRRGD